MPRAFWNALLVLLLVAGPAWIWAGRQPGSDQGDALLLPSAPAAGHPAPAFALSGLSGDSVSLAALRGRPVILNFWATWCPPCRAEAPALQAASQRYGSQVVVVGVDQSEPADTVRAYVQQNGLSYRIALDDSGAVGRLYGVRNLPTTFFIDGNGVVRQVQIGGVTEATLAQVIEEIALGRNE